MQRLVLGVLAALGLALGGIPAVLIAGLIVKSLPLDVLRWVVVCVVVYAAAKSAPGGTALIGGAQAMGIGAMLETLRGKRRP